jgi:hypothetical protein
MARTVTFRLGAALAAVAFAVTSGVTAMDVHRLAAHRQAATLEASPAPAALHALAGQPASGHHVSAQHLGARGHGAHASRASSDARPAAASATVPHTSGHSEHQPDDCNCVGPCASVIPPTLSNARFSEISLGETAPLRVPVVADRVVEQDPRSHILPFPNAPPAHA